MSLIDSTYFIGEISINNASSNTNLTQAITQYEKEILISLLGYKLYKAMIADLTGPGSTPVTQIYIDLINGAEFDHEYGGDTYTLKWEGLKNTALKSLIAYYTYYKLVERENIQLYGQGITIVPSGKDWTRVSPVNKLCQVWDQMRRLYGVIPACLEGYFSGPVKGSDLSEVYDIEPSAYNFLYANKDNYPDWIFTPIWGINPFGI